MSPLLDGQVGPVDGGGSDQLGHRLEVVVDVAGRDASSMRHRLEHELRHPDLDDLLGGCAQDRLSSGAGLREHDPLGDHHHRGGVHIDRHIATEDDRAGDLEEERDHLVGSALDLGVEGGDEVAVPEAQQEPGQRRRRDDGCAALRLDDALECLGEGGDAPGSSGARLTRHMRMALGEDDSHGQPPAQAREALGLLIDHVGHRRTGEVIEGGDVGEDLIHVGLEARCLLGRPSTTAEQHQLLAIPDVLVEEAHRHMAGLSDVLESKSCATPRLDLLAGGIDDLLEHVPHGKDPRSPLGEASALSCRSNSTHARTRSR